VTGGAAEQPAAPRGQRRGARIAMTATELAEFLASERTCRVATVSADGPHVTPLWFVWDGDALWLNSIARSQRWTDWERDNRVAVVIDTGEAYTELRGVEIRGRAEVVGDVPRSATPDDDLVAVERQYAEKYAGSSTFTPDGRHAWRRIVPDKITSWDFRKMAAL
jgi:hypothetical protein